MPRPHAYFSSRGVALPPLRRVWNAVSPWLTTMTILLFWQVSSDLSSKPSLFSSPTAVISAWFDLAQEGILWPSIGASLVRVCSGVALGIAFAVPCGLVAGASHIGYAVIDKPVHMLRAIPFPALSPLLIIALGIGEGMKITLIAIGVFSLIYVNLRDGVRNLDPKLLELAQAYHMPRRTILTRIMFMGALPSFMTGLRFAIAVAWIALVTCETVNSSTGIGYILSRSQQFSRTDQMMLCVVLYALLGLASEGLVKLLERCVISWRR